MGSKREGVMLAYPVDEKRLSKLPEKVIFQRKLNGERVRVEWQSNLPILYSSCGNEMPYFYKLKERLCKYNLHGVLFDGELYKHGMSREEIHSICSRRVNKHPKEDLLSLNCFDIVDNEEYGQTQRNRILFLNSLCIRGEFIKKVESILAPKKDFLIYADQFIKEGYEGVIIRHPQGLYTPRKTGLMLKFKPTEEDIYPIVGYQEEEDIHGWKKNRLGSVLVKDDDGCEFSVGTGNALDSAGRDYWWLPENRQRLTKLFARVKHSEIKTVNGFPTCTSLLKIEIGEKK
jgi:ATP-dependent DNA ligase